MSSRAPEWSVQPPERVARAVVRCLRRPVSEVWTSRPTQMLFALLSATPTLADAMIRRSVAKEIAKSRARP
jgi:hypothetical protein